MRNCALIVLLSLLLFNGCLLVDRNIELTYTCAHLAFGKSGLIYIEQPQITDSLPRNAKGQLDLGDIINNFGTRMADVVTSSDVGDWLAYAYIEELKHAGYDVKAVKELPEFVNKGIQFNIQSVCVDTDIGLVTVGAIATISYDIIVWRDDVDIGTFRVEGKAQERDYSGLEPSSIYGIALRKALIDSIKRSLPLLFEMTEG